MTLTIQDKKDIREIIDQALTEFAKDLIKPSFDLVYKKFAQVDRRFDKVEVKLKDHDQRFDSLERKVDLVAEKVTSHEKRITILETSSKIS